MKYVTTLKEDGVYLITSKIETIMSGLLVRKDKLFHGGIVEMILGECGNRYKKKVKGNYIFLGGTPSWPDSAEYIGKSEGANGVFSRVINHNIMTDKSKYEWVLFLYDPTQSSSKFIVPIEAELIDEFGYSHLYNIQRGNDYLLDDYDTDLLKYYMDCIRCILEMIGVTNSSLRRDKKYYVQTREEVNLFDLGFSRFDQIKFCPFGIPENTKAIIEDSSIVRIINGQSRSTNKYILRDWTEKKVPTISSINGDDYLSCWINQNGTRLSDIAWNRYCEKRYS